MGHDAPLLAASGQIRMSAGKQVPEEARAIRLRNNFGLVFCIGKRIAPPGIAPRR
jgi:hypothetical protein